MNPGHNPKVTKTVLLVDDDSAVREALGRMLEAGGFEVVMAENGKEALRCLETRHVDLAVIDMFMPEMEGVETILHLRRAQKDLPIVAISGGALISSEDSLRIARSVGATSTLAKPFTHVELLEVIETASGFGPLNPE